MCPGISTPRLIIETGNTMLFPFLDPGSNRVSINLIYLRNFFDLPPLGAEQNTVRTDSGPGGRIMFHDFCQSVTLAFCQKTHVSHDHHPRGQCCSSAKISRVCHRCGCAVRCTTSTPGDCTRDQHL